MWRHRFIPILALLGILASLAMVYKGLSKPIVPPLLFEPARSPYPHSIAAEGVIEAQAENINIGPAFSELIMEVYHCVGDEVKKGEPLFKLDTRRFEAELHKAQEEERSAKTDLENKEKQFSYYHRLKDKAAVSEQAFTVAYYDYELAKNRLATAGAAVQVFKTEMERSITRAPCDGKILQAGHAKVGEYANANPFDNIPTMVFGEVNRYQMRIDIDETDAWRYKKGAAATAFVRGNPQIAIPLIFDYLEPFMIPKKTLSGSNLDRVDTRVLQVVYEFSKEAYPIYVGQSLDIFIETEPIGAP